jgi:threonine dehydratase
VIKLRLTWQKFLNENPFMAPVPTKNDIEKAYKRIRPFIKETPLMTCNTLDELTQASLLFKCENFQKAGAFKFRGATNSVAKLSLKQAQYGVCTHSSGNHAQALALAAKSKGMKAFIVMPDNAPVVKVNAVKQYGGVITFCFPTLQAREETLNKVQAETGSIFVHPYDNFDVIEGQSTCYLEILRQTDIIPDYVVCPVGGGGLLSGTLLSSKYFTPSVKVIGAEPLAANDAWKSFKQKTFVPSENPVTIADGLKTSLGKLTWPIIQNQVHDIFTSSEESIIRSMFLVWERMKIVIEPSAAVSLAVVLDNPETFRNKRVAIIFSGGNVDLMKLPWTT